ncbi:MAG TPA: HD domain-containing phosphohydrolase [bacterium]|jgi:putative two-component system response regulator|nr:HD domain-containing phosphohydrolase [bacterium]
MSPSSLPALILIVDDDPGVLRVMRLMMVREGYAVQTAGDGQAALNLMELEKPDLVLLDMQMPGLDGNQVCAQIKRNPRTRLIPVVMHTGVDDLIPRLMAREFDADDYLIKGSSMEELLARVRSLLRLKHYTDELENASAVLATVARIVEKRDFTVREHCSKVATLCEKLGERLYLDEEVVARLRLGATFHDIGKIVIEDAILQKQGPLNEEERAKMMTHAAMGSELIEPMHTLAAVVPLIRHHHEKLDGSGYPDGLKGDQISQEVRVLTVADIYQALVSVRPYKPALSPAKAVEILRGECAKGWWDTTVVEALAGLVGDGALEAAG